MNSRKIAILVITEVFDKNAYSNIVLNSMLNSHEIIDQDKGLITEIVYGTIKYKYTIDKILERFIGFDFKKFDTFILNLLRISIYQMKYLDRVPDYAIVNEAVDLSKEISVKSSKFVNGVLRNYLRNLVQINTVPINLIDKLSLNYSFEKWMVKLFIEQYGIEKTEYILKGLNEIPDNTVRINSIKTTFEAAWTELKELDYNIEEGFICAEAIKIKKGRNIENNELFRDGKITIQDESAMLIAPLMDIENHMLVLDLCSAPGGKATHISEIMNNTGKVKAFDIHTNKLKLIEENAKRLGLTNIEYDTHDATKYNEAFLNSADRVLIDVPCSGFGIIRRKPEIKWNKTAMDLNNLMHTQRRIIANAAKYLKIGGIMLYSTCTLNKNENEGNIKWFIKNNSNFSIEKIYIGDAENFLYHTEGMLTILPNDKMDGFFVAKLKRLR